MLTCHNDIRHLSLERSLDLLKDWFHWPNMAQDIETHIKQCDRCLEFQSKPAQTELHPIVATHPMELVHMDFLTVVPGKANKDVNILMVTDHFTRYAQTFVTPTQMARVVAQTLWDEFFIHYGLPGKILSDQCRNFESSLISELWKVSKIRKLRTSPYRPQPNGQCERFDSTLISMLGTLPNDDKTRWQDHVSTLIHTYNGTHLFLRVQPILSDEWETCDVTQWYRIWCSDPQYFSNNQRTAHAITQKQATMGL